MDLVEEVASGLTRLGRSASVSGDGPNRVVECRTGARYALVSLKNGELVVAFFESPTTMPARKSNQQSAERVVEQVVGWVPASA